MTNRVMPPNIDQHDATQRLRRARARRTAWLLGGVALVVYLGFLASGMFGQ